MRLNVKIKYNDMYREVPHSALATVVRLGEMGRIFSGIFGDGMFL